MRRRPMMEPVREVPLEKWRIPHGPWHVERRAIASGPARGEPVMLDTDDGQVTARGIWGEVVMEDGRVIVYLRVGTAGWVRLHWPVAAWVAKKLPALLEHAQWLLEQEDPRSPDRRSGVGIGREGERHGVARVGP